MFERIIVPCDLTGRNRIAVEMAAELAASSGSVRLLHVIEIIPGLGLDEEKDFYEKLEGRARSHLEELGKILEAKSVPFQVALAFGPRAKTIVEEAEKLNADLIVVRSHRVGEATPAEGWGTLSYQVGIFAACPVLLVK